MHEQPLHRGSLFSVAEDLHHVAERLWERPDGQDPAVMLALATRGRDDMSRRVACANVSVAAAIIDVPEPDGLMYTDCCYPKAE